MAALVVIDRMLLSVIRNIGVLEGGDMAVVIRIGGSIFESIVAKGASHGPSFFIRSVAPVILPGYGRRKSVAYPHGVRGTGARPGPAQRSADLRSSSASASPCEPRRTGRCRYPDSARRRCDPGEDPYR